MAANFKNFFIKYRKLLITVIIGLLIWFLPIKPAALSFQTWHLLAIFIATIIGCILQPLPLGAVSLIGMTVAILTNTLKLKSALSGFSSSVTWLVVAAFFFARGFIKSGLGNKIAYLFIKTFGSNSLKLVYSLIGIDFILAPATPSNTARAGGIIFPLAKSLSEAYDSDPNKGTQKKLGSFLIFASYHGNIITSTIFLTGAAVNLIGQAMAAKVGINISWFNYFLASFIPGIIALIVVPFIIYKIYPPEIKQTPNARKWADKKLKQIGPMDTSQKKMLTIFVLALLFWITGSLTGISATATAFMALSLLILTNVINWDDVKSESGAWNTLIWFSILVMMAGQLNKLGFIPWLSHNISHLIAHHLPWFATMIVLFLANHYIHYFIASGSAQATAVYLSFLGVAIAAGVPKMFAALMLMWSDRTMCSTTHYSNGAAPIFYGAGYVTQKKWWEMNAEIAWVYFIIWIGLGSLWLKIIGVF